MQVWTSVSEHKAQSILVLLQMITVFAGLCFVKAIDELGPIGSRLSFEATIIDRTGFFLLIVPPAWIALTMYLERRFTHRYRLWMTIVSGIALFIGLMWMFLCYNRDVLLPVH